MGAIMNSGNKTMHRKVVLITGASRGIGKAMAITFAKAGANIAICARDNDNGALKSAADEIAKIDRHVLIMKADVSIKKDIENFVEKTIRKFGKIDTLINNAGINPRASIFETDENTWDKVMDVNVKGCFLCSQIIGKIMVNQKSGNIINIASVNGYKALINRGAYCVSKAGVIMLTKVFARELGQYNVRVNAIAPYITMTPMMDGLFDDPEFRKSRLDPVALGRFAETDDIVGSAIFLASDAARWITGHILAVDGGYLA